MKVEATGPGRHGTIDEDGVGKLVFSNAAGRQAKMLHVLLQEVQDGNFGFWTAMMWAHREDKLTKTETKSLEKLLDRIRDEFEEFVGLD